MKKLILTAAMLLAVPAYAQQSSPTEQALGAKLMQEIQGSLTCSTNLITVRGELASAQARIKELEPKKDDPK